MGYTMTDKTLPGSKGKKALQKQFKTTKDALQFYNRQAITHLSALI